MQITLYVNSYGNEWLSFPTDLVPSQWGKLYLYNDNLYWLSSTEFGGDQLTTLTRPW